MTGRIARNLWGQPLNRDKIILEKLGKSCIPLSRKNPARNNMIQFYMRRRKIVTVIDIAAKELQMKPGELLKESLKTYLEKRLSKVEADIFLLTKKYGVKDVFEFDSKLKEGFISEEIAYDDYFTFDNLEEEREKLKAIFEKL